MGDASLSVDGELCEGEGGGVEESGRVEGDYAAAGAASDGERDEVEDDEEDDEEGGGAGGEATGTHGDAGGGWRAVRAAAGGYGAVRGGLGLSGEELRFVGVAACGAAMDAA